MKTRGHQGSVVPTPTPAAEPGTVVVAEDFTAGTLPAGWRAIDGEWTVRDGRLHGTATSGTRKITFGRHLTDFRFEATVRFESVAEPTRWTALTRGGAGRPAAARTPRRVPASASRDAAGGAPGRDAVVTDLPTCCAG
ncbi:hypothetical protein ACFY2R_13275 [Micromonospora olivasterospora]|uniref:Uncharacterized protein n=1 Tax=Micromonospora olivasterospora TaxID=1880 RepID=A0A562IKL7_MICOL|nr:hypothetical protein [Micromonospora olivasterospora]TWH71233.1 hypothetical protein JD77_06264 [Micromonospora olivasterospora]